MEPWLIALILKPFAALLVFVLLVYPLRNIISRALPDGSVKRFLFRERTRQSATRRDKIVMTVWVIGVYIAFFTVVGLTMN